MATLTSALLGARAKGAFGPAPNQTVSHVALDKLQGDDFIMAAHQSVVGGCGDERLDQNGSRLPLPPVFGGLFSAILADALTTRLWYRPGMSQQDHALAMTEALRQMQPTAKLCVHTDEHSIAGAECGCAAIAKAPAVLELLIEYADLIDEKYRDTIVANAHELLAANYFQPGTAHFVDELEAHGVTKEVLAGSHTGIAVLINEQDNTLYDRPAFYAWCKSQNLAETTFFEYSRWAMRATARQLTPSQAASDLFFAAADAFNRVVPYAICNQQTLIINRQA